MLALGIRALSGPRKSLPHLIMAGRDLAGILAKRYAGEAPTREYTDQLRSPQAAQL